MVDENTTENVIEPKLSLLKFLFVYLFLIMMNYIYCCPDILGKTQSFRVKVHDCQIFLIFNNGKNWLLCSDTIFHFGRIICNSNSTEMMILLKESVSLFPTVDWWVLECKHFRTSVEDEPRIGWLKTAEHQKSSGK